VFAHDDDEVMVAPILARYAREGVQVYEILATDGAQGGAHTTIPRGPELARVRADEAKCSAEALGIRPTILLGFPDAKLGDYVADPSLLYRLTQRVAEELARLRPDAVITFGPDGATGHPDHRLVGDIVTQLARAGAPGVPERLFYPSIPAEGFRVMNPARGAPPLLVPQAKYLSVRVPFTAADLEAARRAMLCHRTQYNEEVVQRVHAAQAAAWNGAVPLAPAFSTAAGTDLFR
jgi:LmbE family N-acetylglucosaminyl deacetylase